MVFGFTQCKKNLDIITPVEGVRITLDVDGGSRLDVTPGTGTVEFSKGDKIYVGYEGKYVGTLTHNGTQFEGPISATGDGSRKLYFYFLGNKTPAESLTQGTTTSCSVSISDQTSALPVISMAPSNEDYNSSTTTSYTAQLLNKCALVKFNVTTPSTSAVSITGMHNHVTVNFGDNTLAYDKVDNGLITMPGVTSSGASTWAILLPQDALSAGGAGSAYTSDNTYSGSRPAIPAIKANDYLDGEGEAIDMTVNYDRLGTPVTFEAKTAGATIEFVREGSPATVLMDYSTDGINWLKYNVGGTGTHVITLNNEGDKVMFRANSESSHNTLANDGKNYHRFHVTNSGDLYAYGNVMSLLYDNFSDKVTLEHDYTFCQLFYVNKEATTPELCHIYNHPTNSFVLPATTLRPYCYYLMFYDCTQMTVAPALPATELASNCYNSMFSYCTSLTEAPGLPATSLAVGCYNGMFSHCTSLATVPALPAKTLAISCYEQMFTGCIGLTSVPNNLLPATTLAEHCYVQMFWDCTNLTNAPDLPAETLVTQCYYRMFMNCSKLNSITCLATSGINTNGSTTGWLDGVAASGTFTRNSSTPVVSGTEGQYWPTDSNSGIPSGWSYTPTSK